MVEKPTKEPYITRSTRSNDAVNSTSIWLTGTFIFFYDSKLFTIAEEYGEESNLLDKTFDFSSKLSPTLTVGFCTWDALCQIAHYEPSPRLNIDSVNRTVLKLMAYNIIEQLVFIQLVEFITSFGMNLNI